jgi:hypothetical protein
MRMRLPSGIILATQFDSTFWEKTLKSLSYPVKSEFLDIPTLRNSKAITNELLAKKVLRLYQDDYTEIAVVEIDETSKLSRSLCSKTARSWKQNRLTRPFLIITNGNDCYAVIVSGKGTGGEVKILGLSDRLYHTDLLVLESLRFPGNADALRQAYDSTFFPYERVRDEFFIGYRELYRKVEKAVHKYLKKDSTSYAQRFLGRLMFIYFLQRKGWLKKDKQFVNTISDYKKLNEFFYEGLNREGEPGIPFLNGSLFEREDYMTSSLEKELYRHMDPLFKEARSFFNNYNFTVDEASPLELEVSIDPALIGTVFENMLPEFERGSKGTFYTPSGESSFICRRALSNYLGYPDQISQDKQHFKDGLTLYLEKLRELKNEREVREFREKLITTVILDPAVGSGGFLLVAMQEIILLIQEAEATVGWKSDPEEYKKLILPNLYGFDIEPEAIEIARLRLWLSLIIDQKEAEPLPNLDLNLIAIRDSLLLPDAQTTLDQSIEDLRTTFHDLKQKYLNEHNARTKKRLRDQLDKIRLKLAQKTGTDPFVIEAFMPMKPNIVVMNPPYVRQEGIPETLKNYYTTHYKLDKKSDLFAYFLVRALNLLSPDGVVSVISSDKWLETGYGISLQVKLKDHLVAIFGQKERSFGADINTIISVYGNSTTNTSVHFTYLERYSDDIIRRDSAIEKNRLVPGKWFYIRAPRIFMETILPQLTHKLSDFAEIKFGIKTGANEFFYMKDISHLFENDFLSNPTKFSVAGIGARTNEELKEQELIYIENEGGERYVIDKKDVAPIVRSPRQLGKYRIDDIETLCLFTDSPGKYTQRYIKHGEKMGIHNRPSLKSHEPWFKLTDLKPSRILLIKSTMDTYYVPIAKVPVICDQRLYTFVYKKDPMKAWLYLASTVFALTEEIFCRRLAGGASDMAVEDYQDTRIPMLDEMKIDFDPSLLLGRTALKYTDEVKQDYRRKLDLAVLEAMGIGKPEEMLDSLYDAYLEAVEDRIVKSGGSLKEFA